MHERQALFLSILRDPVPLLFGRGFESRPSQLGYSPRATGLRRATSSHDENGRESSESLVIPAAITSIVEASITQREKELSAVGF